MINHPPETEWFDTTLDEVESVIKFVQPARRPLSVRSRAGDSATPRYNKAPEFGALSCLLPGHPEMALGDAS